MARSDDPGGFDPHPGDPWHPSWLPDESPDETVDEAGRTLAGDETPSSVDEVYAPLRDLGDEAADAGSAVEADDAAAVPVHADVEPLQSVGADEPAADIDVEWETRNLEEERVQEAAAATFAGRELRSIAAELAEATDEVEAAALTEEEERRATQVEGAEGDWVHGEITGLEQDLAATEAASHDSDEAREAARAADQVEEAWSDEAAEAARIVEGTYAEFEDYREGVETDVEDSRRATEVEEARVEAVGEEMATLERELSSGAGADEAARAADEEQRLAAAVDAAAAAEVADDARATEGMYREFEDYRDAVSSDAEEARRLVEQGDAEVIEFGDRLRSAETRYESEAARAEAGAADVEAQRSRDQTEQLLGAEAGEDLTGFAEDAAIDALLAEDARADAEALRADEQIEMAAADEFAVAMEATQLELIDDVAAAETASTIEEHTRLELQKEDAAVVEEDLAHAEAAARHKGEEDRLRFAEEIDERFALDAELARVDDAIASVTASTAGVVVEEAPPRRRGWFRRLFGRATPPAVDEPSAPPEPALPSVIQEEPPDGEVSGEADTAASPAELELLPSSDADEGGGPVAAGVIAGDATSPDTEPTAWDPTAAQQTPGEVEPPEATVAEEAVVGEEPAVVGEEPAVFGEEEEPPAAAAAADPIEEASPSPIGGQAGEQPAPDEVAGDAEAADAVPAAEAEPPETARPSWLARLFGRGRTVESAPTGEALEEAPAGEAAAQLDFVAEYEDAISGEAGSRDPEAVAPSPDDDEFDLDRVAVFPAIRRPEDAPEAGDEVDLLEDDAVDVEDEVVPVEGVDVDAVVGEEWEPVEGVDAEAVVEDEVVPVEGVDIEAVVEDEVVPVEDEGEPVVEGLDVVWPVEDDVVPVEDDAVDVEDEGEPLPGLDIVWPEEGEAVPVEDDAVDVEDAVEEEGEPVTAEDDEYVASFADAWAESAADDDIPDFAAFTSEHYVRSSTAEYADLAEEVARAAAEDSGELAAVSAPIPGLESGVVGLDDVVAGELDAEPSDRVSRRSDLALRVGTGLGLLVLFFGSLVHPLAIGLLVLVVMLVAASEFYTVLIRSGYRPVALFGFLGLLGAQIGTWVWGVGAISTSIIVTTVATALVVGVAPARRHTLENIALTVGVMAWVGGFGAFAFAIIDAADYRWLVAALVVTTAFMDVAQYFVGRRIGRHALAKRVSPKKTVEGLAAGVFAAVGVGVGFGFVGPFDLASGLALGAAVAVVAPFGDLAVSVVKRALDVKDMGAVLPGHGGVLDRVDAMIFVLPAAWMVYRAAGLLL